MDGFVVGLNNERPNKIDEVIEKVTIDEIKTSNEGFSCSSMRAKLLPKFNPPFPVRSKKRYENAMYHKIHSFLKLCL